VGTINYVANGDKAFSKERAEVFVQGRVAILEDYRMLQTIWNGKRSVVKSRLRVDKGHRGEWESIEKAIRSGGPAPIRLDEVINSTLATFALAQSAVEGGPIRLDSEEFLSRVRGSTTSGRPTT
jgi:hypothetical protein